MNTREIAKTRLLPYKLIVLIQLVDRYNDKLQIPGTDNRGCILFRNNEFSLIIPARRNFYFCMQPPILVISRG